MAASKPRVTDLTECQVCTDQYKDPRLLSCGHHFCLVCLQKIAEDSDVIICPTCRYQTEKPAGALKKYKFSEFEVKSKEFMENAKETDKLCPNCQETVALFSCLECRIILCNDCAEEHKVLEEISNHTLQPLSNYQFCKNHDSFVSLICNDCKVGCCLRCFKDHKGHKLLHIPSLAKEAREFIREQILGIGCLQIDVKLLEDFRMIRNCIKRRHVMLNQSIDKMRDGLKRSLNTLDKIKEETDSTILAEIKYLDNTEFDLMNFIQTKSKMMKTLSQLEREGSDIEVIFRKDSFPKYTSSSCWSLVDTDVVKIPDINDMTLCEMLLKDFERLLYVEYDSVPATFVPNDLQNKPLTKLEKMWETAALTEDFKISSMAWHPVTGNIIVRTTSPEAPVQIIDSSKGQLVRILGKDIPAITQGLYQGIAYDVKRMLYVLSSEAGSIVTMEEDGALVDHFLFPEDLSSSFVAVSTDCNQYYVSGYETGIIQIIDVETSLIRTLPTNSLLRKQTPIAVRYQQLEGKDEILASCLEDSCVKVFDSKTGTLKESYGPCVGGITLCDPYGLCVDPAGRILVCDSYCRLVALWTESGVQKSEIHCDCKKNYPGGNIEQIAINRNGRSVYLGGDHNYIFTFKAK